MASFHIEDSKLFRFVGNMDVARNYPLEINRDVGFPVKRLTEN